MSDLGPNTGQAMGLNVFNLVTRFGLGSLAFSAVHGLGLGTGLALFGTLALLAAAAAARRFHGEVSPAGAHGVGSRPEA